MSPAITRWMLAVALGIGAAFGVVSSAAAECSTEDVTLQGLYDFEFIDEQYDNCFRDVVRGGGINAGHDLGGTGHTALNISGRGGSNGRSWVTVVDRDPGTPAADLRYGSAVVCADVLIQRFDNTKGAGVVALYQQGDKGLALILYNGGNSDRLTLATVAGDANGAVIPLMSVKLRSQIAENTWYRVVMTVLIDERRPELTVSEVEQRHQVVGQVFAHVDGRDPNSEITPLVGAHLDYMPQEWPLGTRVLGEEGIIGSAINAVVNSSVTNFSNVRTTCKPPGPPTK